MLSIGFSGLTHNNIILAPALQGQVNKSLSSEYLSEDDLKVVQTQTYTLMNTHRLLKGHYLLGVRWNEQEGTALLKHFRIVFPDTSADKRNDPITRGWSQVPAARELHQSNVRRGVCAT